MGNAPQKDAGEGVNQNSTDAGAVIVNEKSPPPKCKACCACPETKKIRDQCVIENGEENCAKEIESHKQCMRDLGFKI